MKKPECLTTDEWIIKMWFMDTVEHYLVEEKTEIKKFI